MQQLVGHVGNGGLGRGGLTGVLQPQSQHHLALPQGDGIHQRGLDLFQHQCVVVLDQPGLRAHLDRNHPGQLKIVDLLFKTIAEVGIVVVPLSILLSTGLGRFFPQLLQRLAPGFVQRFFARQDIHGQFFIVFGIQIVHLVQ